ncbi:hypothetical protein TIFTF001_050165 [Ficus carica]|uniref:Uncharacterized protein n=1 Tax=Ficus carica TaxID=3494 RepID=A0AA87ZC07_FICCA|nr:hypothetical protein TIFTF001_050165 [Ficus carica]
MGDIYELVGAPSGLISSPDEPRLNFSLPQSGGQPHMHQMVGSTTIGNGVRTLPSLSSFAFASSPYLPIDRAKVTLRRILVSSGTISSTRAMPFLAFGLLPLFHQILNLFHRLEIGVPSCFRTYHLFDLTCPAWHAITLPL